MLLTVPGEPVTVDAPEVSFDAKFYATLAGAPSERAGFHRRARPDDDADCEARGIGITRDRITVDRGFKASTMRTSNVGPPRAHGLLTVLPSSP
jgi:hypothetical protein